MKRRRSIHRSLVAALLLSMLALQPGDARPSGARPGTDPWPPQMTVQVGPPQVALGPTDVVDNPFNTLTGPSRLLGYVGNSDTVGYVGGSLETLRPLSDPVLRPGTAFDSCGAWLNSTWRDGSVIRGWYHAETDCAYPDTLKSVAYAESHDGGRTFTKTSYPHNQVITAPPGAGPQDNGEGDHHVLRVGDELRMYFIASRDFQVRLARSDVSANRPADWHKYHQGAFSEPGLGGASTPIDPSGALTRSWVSFSEYLDAYIGFSFEHRHDSHRASGMAGFGLTASRDGLTGWQRLGHIVLPSEGEYWGRGGDSWELTEYPSMISPYGDGTSLDDVFWLYYMYLAPGADFTGGDEQRAQRGNRYLLRRKVWLKPASSARPVDLVPRIALTEYRAGADRWFTTSGVGQGYEQVGTIGYLFTDQVNGAEPVYDCYIEGWDDHMLTRADGSCDGNRTLRRIGWVSRTPFDGSVEFFRCWDEGATNHFVSTDPGCEGSETEWSFGFLATQPSFPTKRFVALSTYYDARREDHRATTVDPPTNYAFGQRLGYLFTQPQPGRVPVYDCYIEAEQDHMLVPGDASCDGATNLGSLGWISTRPFDGGRAIHRCHDTAARDHFVAFSPACDGKHHEWRIGYLADAPEMPTVPTPTPTRSASSTPSAPPPPTATVTVAPSATPTRRPPTVTRRAPTATNTTGPPPLETATPTPSSPSGAVYLPYGVRR